MMIHQKAILLILLASAAKIAAGVTYFDSDGSKTSAKTATKPSTKGADQPAANAKISRVSYFDFGGSHRDHRRLSETKGGCKTQQLSPCGKQEWCLDISSGEWLKSGEPYDMHICALDEPPGTGEWSSHKFDFDGLERSYLSYAPNGEKKWGEGSYTGLMLFLHGAGGSSRVHRLYDVATYADKYGFVAVVPDGSPFDESEKDVVEDEAAANVDKSCEYYLYQDQCYEVCGDGKKPIVDLSHCEGKTEWGQEPTQDEKEGGGKVPVTECANFQLYLYGGKCYEYCKDTGVKIVVGSGRCAGMEDMLAQDVTEEVEGGCEYYLSAGKCYEYCGDPSNKPEVDLAKCAGKKDPYDIEPSNVIGDCKYYLYSGLCYEYCGDPKNKPVVNSTMCDGKAGATEAADEEGGCDYYLAAGKCYEYCGDPSYKPEVDATKCAGKTDPYDTEPSNVIGDCKYYLSSGLCYEYCGDPKDKSVVVTTMCDGKAGASSAADEEGAEPKDGCEYYLYFSACYEVCGNGDTARKPIVNTQLCAGKVDMAEVAKSGGNRKLQGTFKWNLDDQDGVDEVSFLKHIVAKESEAHSIDAEAPKIAMGFSNGAGMAILLGCQEGGDLWVAHTAVPIDMAADFPSTCACVKCGATKGGKALLRHLEVQNRKTSWNAVGENDFFISSLQPTPTEGLMEQFKGRHARSGCPEEDWLEIQGDDFACFRYPSCIEVGELCVYSDIGHTIKPSMTENAWLYLTAIAAEDAGRSVGSLEGSSSSEGYLVKGSALSGVCAGILIFISLGFK